MKKHIEEIIDKIITNIDNVIFCGGISDYINFIEHGINIGNHISDVDIIICDESIIPKLEEIFNSKVIFVDKLNEGTETTTKKNIENKQYYIVTSNKRGYKSHIDIFLIKNINDFKLINTKQINYYNTKLVYIAEYNRYLQLDKTINYWFETAPMTKRLFKYLKKRMIYNKIINNKIINNEI